MGVFSPIPSPLCKSPSDVAWRETPEDADTKAGPQQPCFFFRECMPRFLWVTAQTVQSKVFSLRGGAWGPASSMRLARHLANPRGVAPSKAEGGGLGLCHPVLGWRPRRGRGGDRQSSCKHREGRRRVDR